MKTVENGENKDFCNDLRPIWFYYSAIAVLGLILYFVGLGVRDLWEKDETRYALIARTMMRSGQYILPHFNGEIYSEKPPFFFWTIVASSKIAGEMSPSACRAPSAISSILLSIFTFWFANKLFGKRVAFLSGLLVLVTPVLVHTGRWMIMDPMLSLFSASAIGLAYMGINVPEKRLSYYTLSGLLMGIGGLIKGPITVLMTLLVMSVYLIIRREIRPAFTWKLIPGALLALGIPAVWYYLACKLGGPEYTQVILFRQSVGRFSEGWIFRRPWYYYGYIFPALFLPWTFFLPTGIAHSLSPERKAQKRHVVFLLVWTATYLIFFSLSKSKKPLYMMPTLPAIAMVLALLWNWHMSNPVRRVLGLKIATTCAAVLLCLLGIGIPIAAADYADLKAFELALPIIWALAVCVSAAMAMLWIFLNRPSSSVKSLIASLCILNLFIGIYVAGIINPRKSIKAFSENVGKIVGEEPFAVYKYNPSAIAFFTGKDEIKRLYTVEELRQFLKENPKAYIMSIEGIEGLSDISPPLKVVYRNPIGNTKKVLLGR